MRYAAKAMVCSVLFCCAALPQTAGAKVRLPRLISDGMVLQRDADVTIWGWADAGQTVTVVFDGRRLDGRADDNGRWDVVFSDLKPGGPYQLTLSGNEQIVLDDIYVGDVWVCSGQSNMELPMNRVDDLYGDVIANADNPAIRHFWVPRQYDFKAPREDLSDGRWLPTTPENVSEFSAVGYFFATSLYERYQVPIGLINAALGGAPAQAWLSEEALKAFSPHWKTAMRFRDDTHIADIERDNQRRQEAWDARLQRLDSGLSGGGMPYLAADYDDSAWESMAIPGYWADGSPGPINGSVWFRKEFSVPSALAQRPGRLRLGCIVDSDAAYINGTLVGTTGYQYPPRRYEIPEGLLNSGRNTLVVRVVNTSGRGGFVPDKPYEITLGDTTIDLKGAWKYRVGAVMEPLAPQVFVRWKPMGLYNAVIAPLTDYAIKGVIWYQGESNVGNAEEYRKLFGAVIADWRSQWNQGTFPFLYVQLANFLPAQEHPSESQWAELREAQFDVLSVPDTAMAVAIDIGEWNDIHPLNKADVGKRLALAARKVAYGEEIVYSGPVYESMRVEDGKAVLSFRHIGGGLTTQDGRPLRQFAVAGQDGRFVWAEADIQGDTVIVWSEAVECPVAVRYAWADNPDGANLYNREGLPAVPFRTDR